MLSVLKPVSYTHLNSYDMILLDVMLPKMDGFEVCQAIREFSDVPIVMLTAKGDEMDKILGLEYGADIVISAVLKSDVYKRQGVYRVKPGARVCELVDMAGGMLDTADKSFWNLASEL